MKFSDGLWLNQRGFDVSYAVQAYDVTTTKNSIKIFATSSAIWNRAMTLGGVAFEITYTAVAPDMIRVHICHHKGGLQNKPQFELNLPEGYVPGADAETGRGNAGIPFSIARNGENCKS